MLIPVCYLCGNRIAESPSQDHVPPQQFFAPELRRSRNLDRLVTLPAHAACNRAYSADEDYTVAILVATAMGSEAADEIIRHHAAKFKCGSMQGLIRKVLDSFDQTPSGLVLPRDAVAIRLEGARVERVVWKIVRGLYFHEKSAILPEDTLHTMEMREPENRDLLDLDAFWGHVKSQPSLGEYQEVFAYKYLEAQASGARLHAWAMLWWERISYFVAHDDPALGVSSTNQVSPAV